MPVIAIIPEGTEFLREITKSAFAKAGTLEHPELMNPAIMQAREDSFILEDVTLTREEKAQNNKDLNDYKEKIAAQAPERQIRLIRKWKLNRAERKEREVVIANKVITETKYKFKHALPGLFAALHTHVISCLPVNGETELLLQQQNLLPHCKDFPASSRIVWTKTWSAINKLWLDKALHNAETLQAQYDKCNDRKGVKTLVSTFANITAELGKIPRLNAEGMPEDNWQIAPELLRKKLLNAITNPELSFITHPAAMDSHMTKYTYDFLISELQKFTEVKKPLEDAWIAKCAEEDNNAIKVNSVYSKKGQKRPFNHDQATLCPICRRQGHTAKDCDRHTCNDCKRKFVLPNTNDLPDTNALKSHKCDGRAVPLRNRKDSKKPQAKTKDQVKDRPAKKQKLSFPSSWLESPPTEDEILKTFRARLEKKTA